MLNQHLNQYFASRSARRKLTSIAFYRKMEMCEKLEKNPFGKLRIRILTM